MKPGYRTSKLLRLMLALGLILVLVLSVVPIGGTPLIQLPNATASFTQQPSTATVAPQATKTAEPLTEADFQSVRTLTVGEALVSPVPCQEGGEQRGTALLSKINEHTAVLDGQEVKVGDSAIIQACPNGIVNWRVGTVLEINQDTVKIGLFTIPVPASVEFDFDATYQRPDGSQYILPGTGTSNGLYPECPPKQYGGQDVLVACTITGTTIK